jgi:hypothetical membrane protein
MIGWALGLAVLPSVVLFLLGQYSNVGFPPQWASYLWFFVGLGISIALTASSEFRIVKRNGVVLGCACNAVGHYSQSRRRARRH